MSLQNGREERLWSHAHHDAQHEQAAWELRRRAQGPPEGAHAPARNVTRTTQDRVVRRGEKRCRSSICAAQVAYVHVHVAYVQVIDLC